MDLLIVILIALGVIAIAALIYWAITNRRRTRLRERFGPEYDRMVEQRDDRRGVESELAMREKRRRKLDIVPLSPRAREDYARRWHETQSRFVDKPGPAVGEADGLVQEVMRERGYPVEDFSQREADLSVDHPTVLEELLETDAGEAEYRPGEPHVVVDVTEEQAAADRRTGGTDRT